MYHPYSEGPNKEIPMIEANLQFCTLYKEEPYGLAQIQYQNPVSRLESFSGLGFFTDGKLHMGPFTCLNDFGFSISYSMMMNGRPADSSYMTKFFA